MSGGAQQRVANGRALTSTADLLLRDAPSLGLTPIVVQQDFAARAGIRATGLTGIMVEQNARASLKLADRGDLIGAGRIVGHGTASALSESSDVQAAFLGGSTVKTE